MNNAMGMGQLQDFTIDQFAGATPLVLGSVGGLLMIIWKIKVTRMQAPATRPRF